MRTFEFTDDKSNKFWSIDLKGKTLTVVFGKIGTAGQTKPKDFPSEAAAQKEYDKLVREKTNKGYKETTAGGARASAPAPAAKAPAAPAAKAPAAAPAGRRTFEFTDDKSNKFWSIERKGKTVTVVFGKIGTAGQTKPKAFPDEAAAQKEYDKLVREKTNKGYKEVKA
jgi:predicted DNA-binding WGR domain protein